MKRFLFSAILFGILVMLSGLPASGETLRAASPPGDVERQTLKPEDLDKYFNSAHKEFLDGELVRSATEIRKGADILRHQAASAQEEARRALVDAADQLDQLSERMALGFVASDNDLRSAFAHAHQALAVHQHAKAASLWTKQLAAEVARDLNVAALHLKQAWHWSGRRLSANARQAIQSAKDLERKVSSGLAWAAREVDEAIEGIGKEIGVSNGSPPALISQVSEERSYWTPVDLSTAIVRVAAKNIPAVVHVQVTERQEIPNPLLPYENDPLFRRFFSLPKKMPKKFERELVALGTGMIIDPEGHILTNNHVVAGATKIQVFLSDGGRYTAKVLGTDPKTDLGIIKISAEKPLSRVTFGDSDAVKVGQWVVAIGHPRGLDQTVTQGIISAKHRQGVTNPSSYEDFLQTDASINPGNSGGPLLNLYGQVIGVNSAILSQSGGFEGIGFSIPSNMAVHIANELISSGKVTRGWLGINMQELTPDLAKSFRLDKTKGGALVSDVIRGGPAAEAGVKRGDVILAFDGATVPDAAALRNHVANTRVGKKVAIDIWRNGKKEQLTVTVGNLEDLSEKLSAALKERLAISVEPVSAQDAERYGLRSPEGIKISWIDSKGPLGKIGFEKGDIILAINGQPIEDTQTFTEIIIALPHPATISLMALAHTTGQMGSVAVTVE